MSGFSNDVMYAKNADFTVADNQAVLESNGLVTDGKMWIGSTALNAGNTHINVGIITSSTLTIGYSSPNITINTPGGAAITSVLTANATPQFALVGTTETVDFGITNLLLGSSGSSITSASGNVSLGQAALASLSSGSGNVAIGISALTSNGTADSNTAIGRSSLQLLTIGGSNVAVGSQSLPSLTSGGNNTGIGAQALNGLATGQNNIALGSGSGKNYTSSEGSNIVIGNFGVIGESNTIRIGTQGTSPAQQNQTFIAGVINTVSGRVVKTTVPGAYPYTTLTTDYIILVDTASARTINLIASPVTGTTYRIKDNVGTAAANNITITPNAGTIDGAASMVVNSNWGSVDVVYNGTNWRVM